MTLAGRCHCGNIAFELDWDPPPEEIPARACGCTFCTKHGGLWTSNPLGALRVRLGNPSAVSRYAFGTHTASFLVCARCGVVPVVTSEVEGRLHAVVSVNALEDVDPSRIRRSPVSFDGEDEDSRLARRARNWIGRVEIVEGA